jgi:hypothetical protein
MADIMKSHDDTNNLSQSKIMFYNAKNNQHIASNSKHVVSYYTTTTTVHTALMKL